MRKLFPLLFVWSLLLAAGSLLQADGVLANAAFSSPAVGGVASFYGSSTMPGWTITSGSVDVVNLASQPGYVGGFLGNPQAADLNGYIGYTPTGCAATIYQDISTTPGDFYTYSFGLAANTAGGPLTKTMDIFWGDPGGSLSLVGSYSSSSAAFTTYNFTVGADAPLSRLKLVSTTDTTSSWGPYVDFVGTPIITPEPSTLGQIGMGTLIFCALFFKRLLPLKKKVCKPN